MASLSGVLAAKPVIQDASWDAERNGACRAATRERAREWTKVRTEVFRFSVGVLLGLAVLAAAAMLVL